jgi:tRNA-dependent cyclodipeptide synthase
MIIHITDQDQWQGFGRRLLSAPGCRPFIGVSVGSRPLQPATYQEILRWCLQSQAPLLPIMIADEIAHINYMVFSKYTRNYALKRARRDGDRHLGYWSEAVAQLPPEQARRVRFVRWPEVETALYRQQVEVAREEFAKNSRFYAAIIHQVADYILRTNKTYSDERLLALAEYVLEEFPSLLFGIEVDDVQYYTSLYPTTHPSPMQSLLNYVQEEPELAEFRARLQPRPLHYNALIEVLLPEDGIRREPAPPAGQPAE